MMLIAVYGTLRKGEGNHGRLHGAEYVGMSIAEGFQMYSNGAFPYAIKGKGSVIVEVYQIDEETFDFIDRLEGYPYHYQRMRISTEYGDAWIYYIDKLPVHCVNIVSGDWKSAKGLS